MPEVRIEPINAADEIYYRRHYVEAEQRKSASGLSWIILIIAAYPIGNFVHELPAYSGFNLVLGIGLLLVVGFLRWHAMTLSRQERDAAEFLAMSNGIKAGSSRILYKPDYLYVVRDGKPIGRLSGDVPEFGAIQHDRSYLSY